MPLNISVLESAIERITNKKHPEFKGLPRTPAEVAFKWMEAIHVQYVQNHMFPPLLPALAETAGFSLWSALLNMKPTQTNEYQIEKAIIKYASAIASAFAPPYVGTPPTGKLDLRGAYVLGKKGDAEGAARMMALEIDAYFRTGTATDTSNGTTIVWN